MKGWKGFIVAAITLLVAASLQEALAYRLRIFGASPDFLLVALGILAMFGNRTSGMLIGFFDGLLMGAMSGANLQHYVTSRTVAGLILGWAGAIELQLSYLNAVLSVGVVTVLAQLGLLFLAPAPGIGAFMADTIRTAVYNGVLAIPVYALLKRILAPVGR